MPKPTTLDAVRQLFESTKIVCAAIERRLTQKIDTSDQLISDLDARLARLEALEQQQREQAP